MLNCQILFIELCLNLRSKWNLLKCPDRYGIRLMSKMNLKFDLLRQCHLYFGRYNTYSKLYKMLKKEVFLYLTILEIIMLLKILLLIKKFVFIS